MFSIGLLHLLLDCFEDGGIINEVRDMITLSGVVLNKGGYMVLVGVKLLMRGAGKILELFII